MERKEERRQEKNAFYRTSEREIPGVHALDLGRSTQTSHFSTLDRDPRLCTCVPVTLGSSFPRLGLHVLAVQCRYLTPATQRHCSRAGTEQLLAKSHRESLGEY